MTMSNSESVCLSEGLIDQKQLAAQRLKKLNLESERRKPSEKDASRTKPISDSLVPSTGTNSAETVNQVSESSKEQKHTTKHRNLHLDKKIECDGIENFDSILDKSLCSEIGEKDTCTVSDGSSLKKTEQKKRKSKKQIAEWTDSVASIVENIGMVSENTANERMIVNSTISDNVDNKKSEKLNAELSLSKCVKRQKQKERHVNRKRLREAGEVVSLESDVQSKGVIHDVSVLTDSVVSRSKKRRLVDKKRENDNDVNEVNDGISKGDAKKSSKRSPDQPVEMKGRVVGLESRKQTKSMRRRRLRSAKLDSKHEKMKRGKKTSDVSADKSHDEVMTAVKLHEDDHSKLIEGFTILKDIKAKTIDKIQRRLPDWLTRPTVISADIHSNLLPLEDVRSLDPDLMIKLRENGIEKFFPVQAKVIPSLLDSVHSGVPFLVGKAGYRPRDICCSAPTGSGKTLAFVLPIIQALRSRVVCQVRALIVLPVQDLAAQVYKVFFTYCEGTGLKVSLLTGQNTFVEEQKTLGKKCYYGYRCMSDITIATPGRLVDHINKTPGFDLRYLRFLVIDEADRMMDDIKQDWLQQLEAAIYSQDCTIEVGHTSGGFVRHRPQDCTTEVGHISGGFVRHRPTSFIAANATSPDIPLQKLLFSATLSHNPETLQRLNLFQPLLFTSVIQRQKTDSELQQQTAVTSSGRAGDPLDVKDEYIGKFTTPSSLTELCVECTTSEKPLIVLYLLKHLKYRNVLCFTNTVEATHRLHLLLKFHGGIRVREFSSQLALVRRTQILSDFKTGKIHIIICTDQMARGMDIENVHYVLSYDAPLFIKTYIHRVGRTARAGKPGTAVTLLEKTEIIKFRKLLSRAGKDEPEVLDVTSKVLKPLVPGLTDALNRLPHAVKRESCIQKRRPKTMKLSETSG